MSKSYLNVEAGSPVAIAFRLLDEDGDVYSTGDVSSISYTVALLGLDNETQESEVGSGSLTVGDVLFDELQKPTSWTADTVGYNFRHFTASSLFELEGRSYKLVYTFTTPTGPITAEIVVNTYPSSTPSGYCQRRDIEDIFGPPNVEKWADAENKRDGAHVAGRIAKAIELASVEVDDRLRGGSYSIPFTTIPVTIRQVTATLAGVWLYESRGVEDIDEASGRPIHRLTWHRKNAENVLTDIRTGKRKLDAPLANNVKGCRAPFSIRS